MKPDWINIKKDYLTSQLSYKDISEKYGINIATVSERAKREEWPRLKKETHAEIMAETIRKVKKNQVNRNSRHILIVDKILDAIEQAIEAGELTKALSTFGTVIDLPMINENKLESLMRTLERAQKSHRLAEGMDKKIEEKKLEIELRKLELLESKAGSKDDAIAAHNENINTIAELLNNPQEDRSLTDFDKDD